MVYVHNIQDGGGVGPIKGPVQQPAESGKNKPVQPDRVEPQKDRTELTPANRESSRTFEASKLLLETIPDVRRDKVELARRRLAEGYYDKPDIRAEIAARMISDPEANPSPGEIPDDETGIIRKQLRNGYYDRPDIKDMISRGMIDDVSED